jgi:hypothetical protein
MRQVLAHHDLPETDRRSEEKLGAAAICSKIVVGKIGQQQQRVGSAQREGEFRHPRQQTFILTGTAEDRQHEQGHNQSEEHRTAATEITQFFFEDGDHGPGTPGKFQPGRGAEATGGALRPADSQLAPRYSARNRKFRSQRNAVP